MKFGDFEIDGWLVYVIAMLVFIIIMTALGK